MYIVTLAMLENGVVSATASGFAKTLEDATYDAFCVGDIMRNAVFDTEQLTEEDQTKFINATYEADVEQVNAIIAPHNLTIHTFINEVK